MDDARSYLDRQTLKGSGHKEHVAEFAHTLARQRTATRLCQCLTNDLAAALGAARGTLALFVPAVVDLIGVTADEVPAHLARILDTSLTRCGNEPWLCLGPSDPNTLPRIRAALVALPSPAGADNLVHEDPPTKSLTMMLWGLDQALGVVYLPGTPALRTSTCSLLGAVGQTAGMLLSQAIQIEALKR